MKTTLSLFMAILNGVKAVLIKWDMAIRAMSYPGFETLRWKAGIYRVYYEFLKAQKRVPAYRKFLKNAEAGKMGFQNSLPLISKIPVMNKENYIRKYPLEERCVEGRLPHGGVLVDESSGSTGTPTHWVRGHRERKTNKRMIEFGLKHTFGQEPLFVINAFALGSWATGVNVAMSSIDVAILKNTGPDIGKIVHAIQEFQGRYKTIIMGYPPFLKMLVDQGEINWHEWDVSFLFGGEAMSEALRQNLLSRGIRKVISSFGASDLELNMALENDFTIELRKRLLHSASLRHHLGGREGALPMIFQYNPADFFLETNDAGELIVSICRPGYLSPKIRYNIKDVARIYRYGELLDALEKAGVPMRSFEHRPPTDFPFLFHYGRADHGVSFFGAVICSGQIHEVLNTMAEVRSHFVSFKMKEWEDQDSDKRLDFYVQLREGIDISEFETQDIQEKFLDALANINHDFRKAREMMSSSQVPRVYLCDHLDVRFQDNDVRIKFNYRDLPS